MDVGKTGIWKDTGREIRELNKEKVILTVKSMRQTGALVTGKGLEALQWGIVGAVGESRVCPSHG